MAASYSVYRREYMDRSNIVDRLSVTILWVSSTPYSDVFVYKWLETAATSTTTTNYEDQFREQQTKLKITYLVDCHFTPNTIQPVKDLDLSHRSVLSRWRSHFDADANTKNH